MKQKPVNKAAQSKSAAPKTLLTRIESFFAIHEKNLFIALCVLAVAFGLLLFNARVSEGNDDSMYIEAGYNYAHHFSTYAYTANAPLYPLFLGGLTALLGINLIAFKLFSVIFNVVGLVFFYKAFRGRIPFLILFTVCFSIAINSYFQYFASQTYTEAMFLCFQGIFLFVFFKLIDKIDNDEEVGNLQHAPLWLAIGGLIFTLIMVRNGSIAIIPALILFFIVIKKIRYIWWALGSFLVFRIPFEIFHTLLWKQKDQYSGQSKILMLKDPYNPTLGNDDFNGFVARFFDNIQLYLSKRFFQILGFFSENYTETNMLLSVLVIVLALVGLFKAWKLANHTLLFAILYTSATVLLTFIILQTRWDQPRLIMVHMPVLLIAILFGLYEAVKRHGYIQNFLVVICVILVASTSLSAINKSGGNVPIVMKNLQGDKLYGYSPDWKNFFRISEWCAHNLPDSALVASRKASMSFIYGSGKRFFPVYKVYALDTATGYSNPDSVLHYFKRNGVTHIILASLRRDPSKADGNIINTLHRMAEPIARKYPEKFTLVYQEPKLEDAQLEPAYLYKINY